MPLTFGIQNPTSTNQYWNSVPGIRNLQRRSQNTRLSWVPLHVIPPPPPLYFHRPLLRTDNFWYTCGSWSGSWCYVPLFEELLFTIQSEN